MPPERFISHALNGKTRIDLQAWGEMLDRYYGLHGWDKRTGKPLSETFERLQLLEIRERLEEKGSLP
jgi:aldehyde:ferredoxin oxidoreductase